ncbi:MAG: HAMP domain-containing sensor histidine kinase, partial [Verrucomicrobiota bacterium]
RENVEYQAEANQKERAARGTVFNNAVGKSGLAQQIASPQAPPLTAAGMFQPAWIEEEPFLLRSHRSKGLGISEMEGAWLDLAAFRSMLLDEIGDLLPAATLSAIEPGVADALALASFPWKLIPGETAMASTELRGPVVTSLIAGWVAVAVALLAGAALVRGVMKLSERRASFVSAVTHELRTPLTTFRLYSEMLESGAVHDEGKRDGYFKTLRREADRLSHLVENVLAFSRIERGSARSTMSTYPVQALLEPMRERFKERLAGAGMELEVNIPSGLSLRGDAAAIEHVLFNLIDNAAKYAASDETSRVKLTAEATGGRIGIKVSDEGPGIPERDRRRIFRSFHKSAQAAAESRPGVGLGLSLSRRLARQMDGDLDYRKSPKGACFVLSLPKA